MGKKGSERGGFSFCSESIDYSTCQDLCQLTDQRLILPLYRIVSRTLFVKGEDELHHPSNETCLDAIKARICDLPQGELMPLEFKRISEERAHEE